MHKIVSTQETPLPLGGFKVSELTNEDVKQIVPDLKNGDTAAGIVYRFGPNFTTFHTLHTRDHIWTLKDPKPTDKVTIYSVKNNVLAQHELTAHAPSHRIEAGIFFGGKANQSDIQIYCCVDGSFDLAAFEMKPELEKQFKEITS